MGRLVEEPAVERDEGYRGRIQAGKQLAALDDVLHERQALLALLLDPQDTAVTLETAEALLARADDAGLQLVLQAVARADDDTLDWLWAALQRYAAQLGDRSLWARCAVLASNEGGEVLAGWRLLEETGEAGRRD